MIKKAGLVLLVLAVMITFISCGGTDDSEILNALGELAPRVYEMYGIVYGDAVPHGEIEDDGYAKVTEDFPYRSIAEIKSALSEVFTEAYCNVIYNTAFNGVSTDEGSLNAKFGEDETGLYVAPAATDGFAAAREFDLTDAKVIKKNRFAAVVQIPHADGDVYVTLILDDGVWKIDSPMF